MLYLIVIRLRREAKSGPGISEVRKSRQYDPVIIERTIGIVLGLPKNLTDLSWSVAI